MFSKKLKKGKKDKLQKWIYLQKGYYLLQAKKVVSRKCYVFILLLRIPYIIVCIHVYI